MDGVSNLNKILPTGNQGNLVESTPPRSQVNQTNPAGQPIAPTQVASSTLSDELSRVSIQTTPSASE